MGLDILVKESDGSIANIRRMVSAETASLGIVQSDVFGLLGRSTDPQVRCIASRLRLLFPFYNEEVHWLARGHPTFRRAQRSAYGRRLAGKRQLGHIR